MLTGKLRNQVDKIWITFHTGGLANPLSVIEQFTYLLFIRRLDDIHTLKEKAANAFGTTIEAPVFNRRQQRYRWHKFKNMDPQQMFELVRDKVFPFIKTLHGEESTFAQHMKDAIFMIPKASLLDQVVQLIDKLDMEDRDTKGDLYEYMLSKLTTAGTNGQFRTPRHIINMMVAMSAPVAPARTSRSSSSSTTARIWSTSKRTRTAPATAATSRCLSSSSKSASNWRPLSLSPNTKPIRITAATPWTCCTTPSPE